MRTRRKQKTPNRTHRIAACINLIMSHHFGEPLRRETSPTPSVFGGDGLSTAERRQRQALEYEEDDVDAGPAMIREAEVPIPNIPLPYSSDGNVCTSYLSLSTNPWLYYALSLMAFNFIFFPNSSTGF
jgi:hypothetical protein